MDFASKWSVRLKAGKDCRVVLEVLGTEMVLTKDEARTIAGVLLVAADPEVTLLDGRPITDVREAFLYGTASGRECRN